MKQASFQLFVSHNLIAEYDTGGYHYYSDKRLKKSIKPINGEKVRKFFEKLNPISYIPKFGEDKRTRYGILSQELDEAFDESGLDKGIFIKEQDNEEHYQSVTYSEFHGIELAAIKDLYSIIKDQQTQIDALKEEVELLKTIVNTNK